MSRLTRREMKRDEVAEALGRTVEYSRNHARLLIAAGVGVVALILAIALLFAWHKRSISSTNAELAEAMKVYRARIDAESPDPEAADPVFASEEDRTARARELFQEVRGGSGHAADVALIYLGRIASQEGDSATARALWEEFLAETDDPLVAGSVRVSLMELDRSEGNSEKVISDLETMLDASPEQRTLPGDLILSELAATYEDLEREEDALSTYERLIEEYPQSPYAAAARTKIPQTGTRGALSVGG